MKPLLRSAGARTLIGICFAAVLFVAVNSVAGKILPEARLDLTGEGLYTLSDGTRQELAAIREPITLKFYFSSLLGNRLPVYGTYASRVRQVLEQYQAAAPGKIRCEFLDPVPFSAVEDQATAAGLQGVALDSGGDQVYFGLSGTNSTDDRQTIPFFQTEREPFLEYDLTRLVLGLAKPERKVIGLLSGLPINGDPMAQIMGRPAQPLLVIQQLAQTYRIEDLQPGFGTVPADVSVLMIVQPYQLPAKTQYAIDQWVLAGGHALVLDDPNPEFAGQHPGTMGPQQGDASVSLAPLLHAWGIREIPGKVVGDRAQAIEVSSGDDTASAQTNEYVAWLALQNGAFNREDPVTAQLSLLNMPSVGALEALPGSAVTMTPLLRSSAQSELLATARVKIPPDLAGLLADFKPTGTRYVLAARLTGGAQTSFPDGPPKDAELKSPQLKTAAKPLDVIIVADMDFIDDRFWTPSGNGGSTATNANNSDFVANAIDDLSDGDALIGLRSRGTAIRPFDEVVRLQHDAEERYRTEQTQLQTRLKATQGDLVAMAGKSPSQLTPADQKMVDQLRTTLVQTRERLRQLQLALREAIDSLKDRLVFFDVFLIPLLIALGASLHFMLRQRRARPDAR